MYVKFKGVSSGSDTGAICSFCAMIARSAPYDAYVTVSIGGSQSSLVSHSTNYLSFKIGQVIPAPTLLNSGIVGDYPNVVNGTKDPLWWNLVRVRMINVYEGYCLDQCDRPISGIDKCYGVSTAFEVATIIRMM